MKAAQAAYDAVPDFSRRYKYYVLALLSVVSFSNYMDRTIIAVLVEPIKADLDLSDAQMGLLTGFAFAAFYATVGLPIARLADRKKRTVILACALTVWSATTALCGAAQNFIQLLAARIGVGSGEAGCIPASHSLIGDYFPREQRAPALSVFQAGGALGVMLGIMLAGILGEQVGWRLTFVILGLPGILVAVVILFTMKEPVRGRFENAARPAPKSDGLETYLILLRQKTYRNILIAYSLGLFGAYGLGQWSPAFFMRLHDMSLSEVGIWFGVTSGIGGVIGTLSGGFIARPFIERDRRWEVWFPGLMFLICVPAYIVAFLVESTIAALLLMMFGNLVSAMGLGPGLASIQSVSQPHTRATAVALVMFSTAMLGQGGGPLVVGILSDLLTPSYGMNALRFALVISMSILVWSFFHFMLAGRTLRQDMVSK